MGQQMSGGQQAGGQQMQGMGMTRQEGLSQTHQQALMQVTEAIEACAWCADQCIQMADPNMLQCIEYCEDVQEIGEAGHVLLARNSQHSIPALQTLQQAMQACADECRQHNHAHCQDCAQTLDQTIQAVAQLTSGGQGGAQMMGGGQQMGRQSESGQQAQGGVQQRGETGMTPGIGR